MSHNKFKGGTFMSDPTVVDNEPQANATKKQANVCSLCNGNLYVECSCTEGFGPDNAYVDCPYCGGTGKTSCPNCTTGHI